MQLPLLLTVRCIAGLALLLECSCSVRDAGSCVRKYTSSDPDCETLNYGSCEIEINKTLTGNIFNTEPYPNDKYVKKIDSTCDSRCKTLSRLTTVNKLI